MSVETIAQDILMEERSPWRLYIVPLANVVFRGAQVLDPSDQGWKTRWRPTERELAIFNALSENCLYGESVVRHLEGRYSVVRDEVRDTQDTVTCNYYGADYTVQATAIAIERGDISLPSHKAGGAQPSERLTGILDHLIGGKSWNETARSMRVSPAEIARRGGQLCDFYDAVNMPTVLRRSYERGHRWRRQDYVVSSLAAPNTFAGLALSFKDIELTERDLEVLRNQSQGTKMDAIAAVVGVNSRTLSDNSAAIFRKMEARGMAEAVVKARLLGKDLGPADCPPPGKRLTPHMLRLASGIMIGLSNGELGEHLSVSEKTVKNQIMSLFSRLDVRSRAQMARHLLDLQFFVPMESLPPPHLLVPDRLPVLESVIPAKAVI